MLTGALKSAFVLVLCYVFIVSGLVINFLQLLTCVIWPFSRTLYRRLNTNLCYWIWSQYSFFGHWWSASQITLYANPEDLAQVDTEHCLVTMNHKYDIDWIIGYMFCERYGLLGGSKGMVKDVAKYVPIQGWAWYFGETVFVKRDWEKDKVTIARGLQRLTEYPPDIPLNLIVLSEGTRFTAAKHERSLEISRQKGLPPLKHHLLPRPKGFIAAIQAIKGKIPAIYDLTVACSENGPRPKMMTLLQGRKLDIHLRVRRYAIKDIPTDEEGCTNWLYNLYQEKDASFDEFVRNGHFSGRVLPMRRRYHDLVTWIVCAVLSCLPLAYYVAQVAWGGSAVHRAVLAVVSVSGIFLVRKLIELTETEKSSDYGTSLDKKEK